MHRTSKTISCFTSHGVCTDVHQCLCSMFTNGILIENKCFIRQNEIEVIANGICIHQLLLSAKCFILNAATIIAATRLERLQNSAIVWKTMRCLHAVSESCFFVFKLLAGEWRPIMAARAIAGCQVVRLVANFVQRCVRRMSIQHREQYMCMVLAPTYESVSAAL